MAGEVVFAVAAHLHVLDGQRWLGRGQADQVVGRGLKKAEGHQQYGNLF